MKVRISTLFIMIRSPYDDVEGDIYSIAEYESDMGEQELKDHTDETISEWAIFANKGIQVDGTNELHRVSIIVDDVQNAKEEDDVPSKVLPCQLPPKEMNLGSFTLPCTIGSLNLYVIAELEASVNIMPKSMFEHLKLANLKKTDMLVEMVDMTRKAPLGTMENIIVKIKKILFRYDFVTMDMLREPNETMILGRPFLATIHAKIDVFNREISLGIGEDRVLFDMDGSVHHYKEPEVEHRDAKQILDLGKITSRWHVCKPVRVFYDNECGKDCGMWPTCNPDLSFCNGGAIVYGKGAHRMLEQLTWF
ncbi:putative reverse transcriptase domain-containing protein [Tanacetum coccineum]|uniref:Reverse transcriptase domain-containing protein n=1 Tax=Tanacetum coccineum TaxID=301880 RepID=A0ABQ4WH12_9ASTR